MIDAEVHTDETLPRWACVVCHKRIHQGNTGCSCSTLRKEAFQYASVCKKCAAAYDHLMIDEDIRKVHNYLLKKKYWEGVGPFQDGD